MGTMINVNKHKECLDKFIQETASLSLLSKAGGAEVMIQTVQANEIVVVEPSENSKAMEFYFLLEGKLKFKTSKLTTAVEPGDYFTVSSTNEIAQFETLTDVKILYFTTQPIFQHLSSTLQELKGLAERVESKDLYTLGHIDRVTKYALAIGEKMDLTTDELETLCFAAMFHDLGKINVPDDILNKADSLTIEEFEMIKKHPYDGAMLVKKTYYENISTIIEQHHEKIDGTGYPNHLKGEDIKLEAKIIAVADTYDAITTDRSYRKGRNSKVAVDELHRYSNTQFDTEVVKAFTTYLIENEIIEPDYVFEDEN